jgi:hypothetical protein
MDQATRHMCMIGETINAIIKKYNPVVFTRPEVLSRLISQFYTLNPKYKELPIRCGDSVIVPIFEE